MAYRPYIKNSSGTLTDIPLQAEISLKLGTSTVGSSTKPIYLNGGVATACSRTIPAITLNGSSNTAPSFYAPTSAGTSGYVLKSNGSGAPSWSNPAVSVKTTTATCTLSGGTRTRTYSNTCTVINAGTFAFLSFFHQIDPAYASNKGSWANFTYNIPASVFSGITGKGFTRAYALSYSLNQKDGVPQNDYTNSQSQYLSGVSYSDSGGVNITFSWNRWFSEDTTNHLLTMGIIIC